MPLPFFPRMTPLFLLFTLSTISSAQSLRTVALTGQPADDGLGGTGAYGLFGTATLNNDGHVAFLAQLIPEGGSPLGAIWTDSAGNGVKLLAADGRPAGGVPDGVYTSLSSSQPFVNDAGQVLFRGNLAIGSGGVTSSTNSGIWIADVGELPELVLREGDPAPDSNTVFSEQTTVIDRAFANFNSAGQATVHHRLTTATPSTDFGIWLEGLDQTTATVAREGSAATGYTAGTAYYSSLAASPTLNDHGTIAFYGTVTNFPGQAATGSAIWMGTPGNLTRVVKEGDSAPGIAGAKFLDLETPSLNNAGGYAFGSYVDSMMSGLWASRTGGPVTLLYRGDQQPFHDLGANAIEDFVSPVLNAAGEVAFTTVTYDVPGAPLPGVDPNTNVAIWSDAGDRGLREIAREGDHPVDTPAGVEYSGFFNPNLNALGQTSFLADLRGAGITTANNQAIFAEDTEGLLHLVARKGDLLDVDDGPGVDERTILQLAMWTGSGNEDGRRSAFNDSGQLAFTAAFTDGTAGIFISNLVATLGTPGDYNDDGRVDAADYVVWRNHFGTSAELANDPLGGEIGTAQYEQWKANYGASSLNALSMPAARVPEPAALSLLLAVALGVGVIRRPAMVDSRLLPSS